MNSSTADEAAQLVELYGADPGRVRTIAPGVDLETFVPGSALAARHRLGLRPDALTLLFVGRIQPLKAPDVAIRALADLARVPSFTPSVDAWLAPALDAARLGATETLGIPTWHYGHEPPNPFATAIAKFFRNAPREALLLEVCNAGIVFLPGAGGTVQEVFQDACENYYADESAVAPMVLVGPCPGSTTASSLLVSRCVAMEAISWSVDPPGRSVRPTEPANRVSPVSRTSGRSTAAPNRKTTEPPVWPGVWSTRNDRPASSRSVPSSISVTASGSANSYFPPSSIPAVSGDMPAIGSESRCRSAGWMYAVAS